MRASSSHMSWGMMCACLHAAVHTQVRTKTIVRWGRPRTFMPQAVVRAKGQDALPRETGPRRRRPGRTGSSPACGGSPASPETNPAVLRASPPGHDQVSAEVYRELRMATIVKASSAQCSREGGARHLDKGQQQLLDDRLQVLWQQPGHKMSHCACQRSGCIPPVEAHVQAAHAILHVGEMAQAPGCHPLSCKPYALLCLALTLTASSTPHRVGRPAMSWMAW